jgi:hypothetical protein
MTWDSKAAGYGVAAAIAVAIVVAVSWAVFKAVLGLATTLVSTTIISTILLAITWAIQVVVTVLMGVLVVGIVAVSALALAWLVVMTYGSALRRFNRWASSAADQSKEAAVDGVSLALLAGVIGVLAWLTTSDFTKAGELSMAKAIALSAMMIAIFKIALYIDSSNVRRSVWPLLLIFYVTPLAYGIYIWKEHSCVPGNSLVCVFELNANQIRDPVTIVGYSLIVSFALFAMTFPYRIATWKRFIGRI